MKSNLFKQLEQLKESQTARDLKKNRYPSILFSFQQAANFDHDTIKSIASQGLSSLIAHEPSLQGLRERLFNADLDHLKREQLTSAQNQEISEFIQEAIRDLSPYFLLEDCQKVFEYLLRNFEVHNYESESLIVALMPFHATVYYIKLLQNIDLTKTKHWLFMEKNIREGMVVPRSLIAKQCVLDSSILDLLTRNIVKMIENKNVEANKDVFFNVGAANKGITAQSFGAQKNIEVSFGMLIAVETINYAKEKKRISENILMTIMRFLSVCLKSQNNETFRAGLVVILQLISSTAVSAQYLTAITLDVAKKFGDKTLVRDVLLLNVYVHQLNDSFTMHREVFRELVNHLPTVLPVLLEISKTFSVSNIFLAFYRHVCELSADSLTQAESGTELVQAVSKLLKVVIDTESQLRQPAKRLQLAKILVQEIFDKIGNKSKALSKEQKLGLIKHLASILTEVKNCLPDQVTEALKNLLETSETLREAPKQVQKLLTTAFSKLYVEGVLGVELGGSESTADTEYKELLPSISPYHPISTAAKLKALGRVEKILENGMDLEDVEGSSLQSAFGSVVLSHFRTHSYNEKIIETLLQSERIRGLIDVQTLTRQLIDFLKRFHKSSGPEASSAVKLIYQFIIQSYAELTDDVLQEAKELLVETIFTERAVVLKENLKVLKKVIPLYFKPIKVNTLNLKTVSDIKDEVLNNYTQSIGIDALADLEEEYKQARSGEFRELIRLFQVTALEALPSVMPNVPEGVFALLKVLRTFKPKRIQEFGSRFEKIALALSLMEQDKLLDSKPQVSSVAVEAILFLVNLQDTSIVHVVKNFIELFGEDKVAFLLLVSYEVTKRGQERQFVILSLFINNILSTENFAQKDFFNEIMLLLPLLGSNSHQIRVQALGILRNLVKKVNKESKESITVTNCSEFYEGVALTEKLFSAQVLSLPEQLTVSEAAFYKFVKNILKHENELAGAGGSSASKIILQVIEKSGASFADFEWLFRYLVDNLLALPVKELFNLGLDILASIDSRFHHEVVARPESRHLLLNIERIVSFNHVEKTINHENENILLANLLDKLGKVYSESNSAELVNEYFTKVFAGIINLCKSNEDPLANIILKSFGKVNYLLLTPENQLEFLELMFAAASHGVSISALLPYCLEVDPTDEVIIRFGENMLENFNADAHLNEKLTFLAELLHFLNRKAVRYLPLLNQVYQHTLTQTQVDTVEFIKNTQYALSLLIALHRQIIVTIVELKTPIDLSKAPQTIHKKRKPGILLTTITGDPVESTDSHVYTESLKDVINVLLNVGSGAILEKAKLFTLIKELFGCLAAYTAFLPVAVSNMLVGLLTPLFKEIEARGPKLQVGALKLLGHVLSFSQTLLRKRFDLVPYIKLLLRVLTLKGKLPSHDSGFIQSKNYHFIEIDKEIASIIQTIGQKSLDYVVYGIISNLIRKLEVNTSERPDKKGKLPHDKDLDSAVNIVFSSNNLEEGVNILYRLANNAYNLTAYYLNRTLDVNKKKKNIVLRTGAIAHGKRLCGNFELSKTQILRSFLTVLLHFGERSLQSREFMTQFSDYLVKGNLKMDVIEEFSSFIVALVEIKNLVSQGLSKLQAQKLSKVNKTLAANLALKKRVRAKTFLKKLNNLTDRLLEALQELIPEELLTLITCRILERETILRIKSRALQTLYEKISNTGNPKLTVKSLTKLRGLLEVSLTESKEELMGSKNVETSNYLQSVFLTISAILKKKAKTFEDGLHESIYEYTKHPVFPVRCSVFYAIALFSEKFPNKTIANLPEFVTELLYSVLICVKATEPHTFDSLVQFSQDKNHKVLQNILNKAQEDRQEDVQSPENCFVLCLNSLVLLLKTYRDMMNPYILTIIMTFASLSSYESRVQELLSLVTLNIEARNLIEPLSIAGDVQNSFVPLFGRRIAELVGEVCTSMDNDTFESKSQTMFKLFLRALDYVRGVYHNREEELSEEETQEVDNVQAAWIDSFCKFALKTNEVQLKKYFLKLNEWSSKGISEDEHKFSLLRKIALYELVTFL